MTVNTDTISAHLIWLLTDNCAEDRKEKFEYVLLMKYTERSLGIQGQG